MTTMSASQLARHTSEALDAVERGESVVIERRGRVVAVLGPPPSASGADLLGSMAGTVDVRVDDDELLEPAPGWEAA